MTDGTNYMLYIIDMFPHMFPDKLLLLVSIQDSVHVLTGDLIRNRQEILVDLQGLLFQPWFCKVTKCQRFEYYMVLGGVS